MRVLRDTVSVNYLQALLIGFVLFVLLSCNNSTNDKSHSMKDMDSMKMKNHKGHKESNNDMKGMDMSDSNSMKGMEGMNKTDNAISFFNDSLQINSLVMPASLQVISSQKPVKPILSEDENVINAQGYIAIDERRSNKVSVRISGRIEKLYVKYDLQYVKKGDKIMDIYSPELNTYQEELLFLVKNKTDQNLIDKAEEKLRLLGISQVQINSIKNTGNTFLSMPVYAPQSGYVFFKPSTTIRSGSMNNVAESTGNKMSGGMGNTSNSVFSGNEQIREGSYVNKGDVLFLLNDLQQVWGMVAVDNIHEQELKKGEKVSVVSELYKNDTIDGVINFIEPVYQQNQKFILARIYLKNVNNKYTINSLLQAKIYTGRKSSLIVPYSSILFLGKRKVVWVLKGITADNNRIYEARDVITGVMNDGMIEINSGLNEGEEIAINAGYLIDRESLIKPE